MPVLTAQSLQKSYDGLRVVNGVHLAVEAGECFGLLGPNGAGKTTTLRLLLGLVHPDGGEIQMLGLPVPAQARQARMRVGVVPQMDNLDPDFTVAENLLVYGRYFGMKAPDIQARLPDLLDFADLRHKADAKINSLSGGMKRRLTLARALVNDPDLIFLDEPTTGLDPQARHMMWQRLRQLTSSGKTIILTTHFMDEAERLCDRLSIMDHGKIIETGTPRQLVSNHIEPQVVEIYGEGDAVLLAQYAERYCDRHEASGETLFCYTRDADPLLVQLHDQPGVRYLNRPANLEDVFIKLTGRELRD